MCARACGSVWMSGVCVCVGGGVNAKEIRTLKGVYCAASNKNTRYDGFSSV